MDTATRTTVILRKVWILVNQLTSLQLTVESMEIALPRKLEVKFLAIAAAPFESNPWNKAITSRAFY